MTLRQRQRGFFRHAGEADPGPLTGDRLDRQAEDLAAFAEAYLRLGPGQRQALDDLLEALWGASAALTGFGLGDAEDGERGIGDELSRIEGLLAAAQEAVKAVRPPYDAFRAGLDGKQRAAFDDLVSGGHGLGRHAISRTGLSNVA